MRSPGLVNHGFLALVSFVAAVMDTGVCSAGVHGRNNREQRNAVPAWEPWDEVTGDGEGSQRMPRADMRPTVVPRSPPRLSVPG